MLNTNLFKRQYFCCNEWSGAKIYLGGSFNHIDKGNVTRSEIARVTSVLQSLLGKRTRLPCLLSAFSRSLITSVSLNTQESIQCTNNLFGLCIILEM